MTRGERNNNPTNIRRGGIHWFGESDAQTDPDFVVFVGMEYGIRAAAKVLQSYGDRGISSLGEIVATWAPSSENDTQAYVADVSARTGFDQGEKLDLKDQETLVSLIRALIWHENGECSVSDQTLVCGVDMALPGTVNV